MSSSDSRELVSRDTAVHAATILVLIAASTVLSVATVPSRLAPVVTVLAYAVVFAGAHAYLWLRGEDGQVPVDSRYRWVMTVSVLAALSLFLTYFGDSVRSATGVDPAAVGPAVGLVVLAVYVAIEGRAAYRDSYAQD